MPIAEIHIHCPGKPGHGSLLLENTAGEKVAYILKKVYEFRAAEKEKLQKNPALADGDVFSINLTKINVRIILIIINSFCIWCLVYSSYFR